MPTAHYARIAHAQVRKVLAALPQLHRDAAVAHEVGHGGRGAAVDNTLDAVHDLVRRSAVEDQPATRELDSARCKSSEDRDSQQEESRKDSVQCLHVG